MGLLARLFISLEKLVKNPVEWFCHIPWIFRMVVVLLLVPTISIIAIVLYNQYSPSTLILQKSLSESTSQLGTIRQEQQEFYAQQLEELAVLDTKMAKIETFITVANNRLKNENDQNVLGTESNSEVSEIAEPTTGNKTLYLPKRPDAIPVHEQPVVSSALLSEIPSNSLQFFIEKKAGWYKIELEKNTVGWIQGELAIEIP